MVNTMSTLMSCDGEGLRHPLEEVVADAPAAEPAFGARLPGDPGLAVGAEPAFGARLPGDPGLAVGADQDPTSSAGPGRASWNSRGAPRMSAAAATLPATPCLARRRLTR